ncbi:MAG: zf-HC2 domain-containing protein [Litoreibacter sp.]|uniref:anti-sigma factor family protein n=1 Tax=Litoreibacter sp. TaxID=1969459 RepID=UPI003299F89F
MSQTQSRKTARPLAAIMFRLPLMIDCATFETFIVDYFEGTLTKRQRFVFELHLRVCRECREYLSEYKATMALTKDQFEIPFSQMGMGDVPEDLIKAVIAARSGKHSG